MPDTDRLPFDRGAIAAAVRPVPFEALQTRARRRRQGRIAGVAAAVVTLVVAGAGLAMAPGRGGAPAAPGRATATGGLGVPADLAMLSPDTAVAFWHDCRGMFASTTDRGRLWSRLTGSPVPGAVRCGPATSRDERWLVLDVRSYWYSLDGAAYVTTDGGLTWRPGAAAVTDVAAFPAGVRAADCGAPSRCAGALDAGPLAVDPAGAFYRLTTRPGGHPVGRYQLVDGVLWATLPGGATGAGAVGRSTDGGATWQSHPLGAARGVDAIAAVDRSRAYALLTPPIGGAPHVLRTGDGGASWQDVTTDLPPTSAPRDLTVRPDGALLVLDADPVRGWVSTDGGAHFAGYDAPPLARAGTGPGVAWAMGPDPARLVVSTDGRTWTPVRLGR